MYLIQVFCVFLILVSAHGRVTNEEYYSMPQLFHIDDFDKCMAIKDKALYCFVTVKLSPVNHNSSRIWRIIHRVSSNKKNYRHDWLRHSICVPESCPQQLKNISRFVNNEEFLRNAISDCYTNKYQDLGLRSTVKQMQCQTQEVIHQIDGYDIFVAIVLSTVIVVTLFASMYEGMARYTTKEEYTKRMSTPFGAIMACFSLPKNWKRLGVVNRSQDTDPLRCINGIRFYNTILVVLAHSSFVGFIMPTINPRFAESVLSDPTNMIIVNGGFTIQTFLLISAWLLIFHFSVTFHGKKEIKFSYLIFAFINRYIRLTPCLLVMVMINGSWLYHLNRGPLWERVVGQEYLNCRRNGLFNILYLNNIFNVKNMCLQQTWYLAADTQLFAGALIVVWLIWKYQNYTKSILTACLAVGILIPGLLNYILDFDIVVRHLPETLYNRLLDLPEWTVMFISAYTNIGGYAIGLIFGCVYFNYKDEQLFTKKWQIAAWFVLTWGFPLSAIFLGYPIHQEYYEHSRLEAALYVAFARNLFAFGIALGIFGVSQGIGWYVRDSLQWGPLQFLGKLTYCVYLVHVSLIFVRSGQTRTLYYSSHFVFITDMLGDIIVSYLLALILCLFVEMPTAALQRLVIPQIKTKEH